MQTKRYFGWTPDLPDQRDLYYGAPSKIIIPDIVDLRAKASPVEEQLTIGSCVAQSIVGALELLDKGVDRAYADLSRLFLYYNIRAGQNTVSYDSGGTIRGGIKAVASLGVCKEKLWPYTVTKYRARPSLVAYQDGFRQRITSYFRLTHTIDMYQCLAAGFPFVFGFTVYESFDAVASTGFTLMPKRDEAAQGGHAVCAVGYDRPKKMFLIRNSWGSSWGLGGYFWMPEQYMEDRNLSDDYWTIRTILNTK